MVSPGLAITQWCNRDGQLILLARALRTFGYGFLSVVLALYLARLDLDSFQIGLLLTASLLGSVLLTLLFTAVADRWGRRRVLMSCALLMALSGVVFAFSDQPWLLLAASLTGTISATSGEVGPFLALEQAILPQTLLQPHRRTRLFAIYNLLGSFAAALGALFSGLVASLTRLFLAAVAAAAASSPATSSYSQGVEVVLVADRVLLWVYAGIGLANLVIFSRLSHAVELEYKPVSGRPSLGWMLSREGLWYRRWWPTGLTCVLG